MWHKDYGEIYVFCVVTSNGKVEYWATNDLDMDEMARLKYA